MEPLPNSSIPGLTIRFATAADSQIIHDFITCLAEYENMTDQVTATPETIRQSLFERNEAETLLAEEHGIPVGFALFFKNYLTFLGKANMFLEDLFVKPEHRNKGYGKALFRCLATIARQRGYSRLDWNCLDWNTPSINFYLSLGAHPLNQWTTYRLTDEALAKL